MISTSIQFRVRKTLLFLAALLTSLHISAAGWVPTDAGLVLNFEPGDQFLLSVMIDGTEYFVCDYPSYNGGRFKYEAKNHLKLVPQTAGATEPSAVSIWTVDTALTRVVKNVNYSLGGASYTMWSNSGQTLLTSDGIFKYLGALGTTGGANVDKDPQLCDVVFAVPTNRSTNMDPNNTLKKTITPPATSFDGAMGTGFLGMTYREVYWFNIPRTNNPNAYNNAALVTFNTTTTNQTWPKPGTIKPGMAAYAFNDANHAKTQRTLFRIYVLNKPISSCSSYFFGWDVQDYKRYRQSNTMTDSTAAKKIYYLDHFHCMEHVGDASSTIYKTDYMQVPKDDSTYYYMGKNNKYYSNRGADPDSLGPGVKSFSQFTKIRKLPVAGLTGEFTPAANAYGKMVVDTMQGGDNMGVAFEPAGYFFQTSSGVNVPMRQVDATTWMSEQMWYIHDIYMELEGRVMLYTGAEFSMSDPGAEIIGWSKWVKAPDIPVAGTGGSSAGLYGWPRIHTDDPAANGGIEFVVANKDTVIIYHNNGHFGADIPYQYPIKGETTVTAQDARLLGDYEFEGWANTPGGDVVIFPKDSTSKPLRVGQPINLKPLPTGLSYTHGASSDTLHLYAKATYKGSINVAISFMQGDKRYFLTHPNSSAPRYARARTFDEWTDVYQGMSDAENSEPNYMSTYKMIVNPVCDLCEPDEVVLDPHHEVSKGAVDSLVFYEHWTPSDDEYIGLYYTSALNTVVANNTWAGIFKSSGGWPTPANPCINSTKLSSTDYFTGMKTGDYEKKRRAVPNLETVDPNDSIALPAYIKYQSNQFDGVAEGSATDFTISGVGVVDEHYVILPDTTDASISWRDSVIFEYHEDVQHEQVWSKLIGKQLLAQMKMGDDTIYFHPNRDKIFNSASELRLSNDFRLRHEFTFIPDRRATFSEVDEANRVTMEETENAFCCNLYSGTATPIGPAQDIVDTLRVWLRPASTTKIKEYFGRWKNKAKGVHVMSDGSRYRDILIKTRTYHYGAEQTNVVLKPALDVYNFGPLKNLSQTLTFLVIRERSRALYDSQNRVIRTEVVGRDTVADVLDLTSATCSLKTPALDIFTIGTPTATTITLTTQNDNAEGDNIDTLTVSTNVTISDVVYPLTVEVPLVQTDLAGDELVWSVVSPLDGKRYFITVETIDATPRLQFRAFDINNSRLQRNKKELKKGSKDEANSDHQYITPWSFSYIKDHADQLALKTKYGVNQYFKVISETTPGVHVSDSSALSYEYENVYTNDNGNYEEQVKLKYGDSKWLKFTGASLTLVPTKEEGSVFSWGYLLQEYELLNNGDYPSVDSLVFGYNNGSVKTVRTRYKAYREYSMLLNNQLVYLCREDSADLSVLNKAEGSWKMGYTYERIADARTFDGGAKSSDLGTPTVAASSLTFSIRPNSPYTSPLNVTIDGKYVNIVDTLKVNITSGRTDYRFKDWAGVSSLEDASVKIPLVRKTYHTEPYDSVVCTVEHEEYNFAFPGLLPDKGSPVADSCHTFVLNTLNRKGTNTLDVDGLVVAYAASGTDTLTSSMDLTNINLAEIRLIDEYGKKPDWCEITYIGKDTITVRCLKDGTRSPRLAYIYFAYIVTDKSSQMRFVNFRLTVSQSSLFKYANNQTLIHSRGITGDEKKANGMQQVHENKRILYYYNPAPYNEADQDVELPVRERDFYGWWRWYREGKDESGYDVSDLDILDSLWSDGGKPRNVGKYNFPFRIIGDSVMLKKKDGTDSVKILMTMGRYTVFHYPSRAYNTKIDPPAKSPLVKAPHNEKVLTYVVDLSNYYDNLPLSMKNINQVDTAVLDTMQEIIEPTLSLREIFELHPWTEMADTLEHYKTSKDGPFTTDKYMEDHVIMAPIGAPLLLSTEQRYRYDNLTEKDHSESLLGYYMRDDNWSSWSADKAKQDTMIWCGGWDADCEWFTYDPTSGYSPCTHPVTVSDDYLSVPPKGSISGDAGDTVIYCLRARSKKTTFAGSVATTGVGDYWFNICRYKVAYHDPRKYGPMQEKGTGSTAKAIMTNDEIEQDYEIIERLNFDYYQPGSDYHVYPRPLPWADASYGYSYPMGPEIPDNRYHNDFAPNFPGPGEYSIINRIPYANYWHKMEQHGGAENGYMIYCDGMSSSGQVAALSLSTHLCEGQKMYFSAYVGNPSNQVGKANPNFTFSVQGWNEKKKDWEDITTYMTGDIQPSNKWSQIVFPIEHEKAFDDFRVRIFNMASDFDGNDFILDDMCVFATKPPVIAYQAHTKCKAANENDSLVHVVLRVDYQGFTDESYNSTDVIYTVEEVNGTDTCFVPMADKYLNEEKKAGATGKPDTIFGSIHMPAHDYIPLSEDSIFTNFNQLADTFGVTFEKWKKWVKDGGVPGVTPDEPAMFRKGYIYENLDGTIRPVLYIVHNAKMVSHKKYTVRISLSEEGLMNSKCAMTSNLKVTNQIMLMINGEEKDVKEVEEMCANTIYDVSMRVRGTLILDSVAPIDLTGTCKCDWLLYGDTADATSVTRYGYKYSDIEKVIKNILRFEPASGESNSNRFARNLGEVNRNEMKRLQNAQSITFTTPDHTTDHPYDILTSLVNNGFLSLYQSNVMVNVPTKDSVMYTVFPIPGTGTDDLQNDEMEVCQEPIVIKLKAKNVVTPAPLIIGGLHRDSTQINQPITVLTDADGANTSLTIPVDSIRSMFGIHAVTLLSTNDPNFHEGVHRLTLEPDKVWPRDGGSYYKKGDNIVLRPASSNNYEMLPGYSYTFTIEMSSATDELKDAGGCAIGNVPFIVAVVPEALRWAPADKSDNRWNNPMNWVGVTKNNELLPGSVRFVPLPSTDVIIPAMPDSLPYPELVNPSAIPAKDSIQQVGFVYNSCDDIRFLPGAAIGQQQRLNCDVTVVDMDIPNEKWSLRAAPVTGMLSGDIYMADEDLNGVTQLWSVGLFDAHGRSYYTGGNASFWLSLYSTETKKINNVGEDSTRTADAAWSKVTNAMTQSLKPAQGWAVYTLTASDKDADVRLPKSDDIYHYYGSYGELLDSRYEGDLRAKRDEEAGGSGKAGKLAYTEANQTYTLTNANAGGSTSIVFGNPTMGYIDIWGFIADNGFLEQFDYIDERVAKDVNGYTSTTKLEAEATTDTITNPKRYLPPMRAIVLKTSSATSSKVVTLNANRIVTHPSQVVRGGGAGAPKRSPLTDNPSPLSKGIMTVTAVNPVSPICTSRLLLGQGYNTEVCTGEDAVLTTIRIDDFTMVDAPATPFNIYAAEENKGLSIDLRDSIVNVPISFYMSDLPYDPVTRLWFTGVNRIDGQLVFYDALLDKEQPIVDGLYIDIETPEQSHIKRYYIRRHGFKVDEQTTDTPTGFGVLGDESKAIKIIKNGHVLIIRDGHIYTMFGQKLK